MCLRPSRRWSQCPWNDSFCHLYFQWSEYLLLSYDSRMISWCHIWHEAWHHTVPYLITSTTGSRSKRPFCPFPHNMQVWSYFVRQVSHCHESQSIPSSFPHRLKMFRVRPYLVKLESAGSAFNWRVGYGQEAEAALIGHNLLVLDLNFRSSKCV